MKRSLFGIMVLGLIALISSSCIVLNAVKDRYKPYEFVGQDGSEVIVKFIFDAPSAKTVWLAGSFNNWTSSKSAPKYPSVLLSQGALVVMEMDEQTGYWTTTLSLAPGRYQFKYVLDEGSLWKEDPNTPEHVDDGFGGKNSIVTVIAQ